MAIRVTQAICLFLSFTILISVYFTAPKIKFISAQYEERNKLINYCNYNHFVRNSETKAATARCMKDACPHKCHATSLGWLNKNSEMIEDETKLFESLKTLTLYSDTARLYAEGFFKANCNKHLANDHSCASYGNFYQCAVVSGCRYSLNRVYDVAPGDSLPG